MHDMTGSISPHPGVVAEIPEAVAELQARVEALYATNTTLEMELVQLRARPPLVMTRPARPGVLARLLARVFPGFRRRRDLGLIRESGFFEAEWYLSTYADVAGAGVDPAVHFLMHGNREMRDPGPHFDTGHYLRMYPDIAKLGINPLVHYVMAGRAEGRSIHPGMPHGKA
jgi:hypothetical protein